MTLVSAALGATENRYVQYEAELLSGSGSLLGSYRILSHSANELVLSPESGALEIAATDVRVVAKFFNVTTDGQPGLGGTYAGSQSNRVPVSNIRFGFAFHQNPQDPTATRFPAQAGTYVYDLTDPAVQEQIRQLGSQNVILRSVKPREDFDTGQQTTRVLTYGLTDGDLARIEHTFPAVSFAVPVRELPQEVRYSDRSLNPRVLATLPVYQEATGRVVQHGRFLAEEDNRTVANVAAVHRSRTGLVPGLKSVAMAIFTPASRRAPTGGAGSSR